MGTPRPKYVANRPFTVGRHSFDVGDPVTGGRPLDLGLKFGFVDNTAKSAKADPDPPTPASADTKEKTP
jgi:hypothetical protein